jgi:hypothetical protein
MDIKKKLVLADIIHFFGILPVPVVNVLKNQVIIGQLANLGASV